MEIIKLALLIGFGLLVLNFPEEAFARAVRKASDKAEDEAIAAAAESAAAEADDLAAAIEMSELKSQGNKGNRGAFAYDKFSSSNNLGNDLNDESESSFKYKQSNNLDVGSNDSEDDNENNGIADVESPINKLLSESTDLANEIQALFEVLSRRENYLVGEMEKLRSAVRKAIDALSENQ